MNRDTLKDGLENGFGSSEYAREELRAEISAMMTGERVGVGHDPQRGAAYVENWVAVLEKDPHEIHRAARDAQKMSDYLMKRAIDREVEGVESGRGRNPTLRVCPMPFDDVGDGVFADAEVAGDPTIALPAVDGMEHLRGEPV